MENTPNRIYTADEFFEMIPETNKQYELHEGEILALASPSVMHQRLSRKLVAKLDSFISSKGGSCEPFNAPLDVKLDDYNVVQPDVFVVCDRDKIGNKRINGAPDFVIEVRSDNRSIDLVTKLSLYMRFGVREYWIADLKNRKVLVYRFEESDNLEILGFDESIPVGIFGGELSIQISGLVDGDL